MFGPQRGLGGCGGHWAEKRAKLWDKQGCCQSRWLKHTEGQILPLRSSGAGTENRRIRQPHENWPVEMAGVLCLGFYSAVPKRA